MFATLGSVAPDSLANPVPDLHHQPNRSSGRRVDARALRHCLQTSLDTSTAARMKSANRGCGAKGFDFSSGWNCTPMNQG